MYEETGRICENRYRNNSQIAQKNLKCCWLSVDWQLTDMLGCVTGWSGCRRSASCRATLVSLLGVGSREKIENGKFLREVQSLVIRCELQSRDQRRKVWSGARQLAKIHSTHSTSHKHIHKQRYVCTKIHSCTAYAHTHTDMQSHVYRHIYKLLYIQTYTGI